MRAVIRGIAGLNESDAIEEVERQILALLISFFLCLNGTASHARPGSFNTNDWQTNGTAEEYFAMFGKFLNEYDLIKMPRDKVIELLGDPNKIVSKQKVPKDCSGYRSIYYIIPKSERNFEFNALRITFLHNEVVAWSIVQDKDESTPIETNVRFMFHQAKPIMNFDRAVIAPMIKGGSLGKPKDSFSLRPISDLKILGNLEGPRDINMFKVEPTVMDERPFFSPEIPVKPCFWSWEQRP